MNKLLACAIFCALQAEQVMGNESQNTLVPLPSVEDFTKGENGWAFALGAGVEYEAGYEGSDEYDFEVDPAGAIQWRTDNQIFYWAGETIGWRSLWAQEWLFDVAIGFDEGREESDSDDGRLNGLGDGEEQNELLLQVKYAFADNWRYWVDARILLGSEGNLGLVGLGSRLGEQTDGSGHELSIALVFHDRKFANKDFGITSEQSAASGLTEIDLDGGYRSLGLNYNYRHYIDEHWQIFGEAVYEHYSSDISDSDITRSDYEAEVGLGFVYIF